MSLLDIIFPKFCLGCNRMGKYICSSCKGTLPRLTSLKCPICEKPSIDGLTHLRCRGRYVIDGVTSFFPYSGIIKKALKDIKYRYVRDLMKEIASSISNETMQFFQSTLFGRYDLIIVPIPLHWRKKYYRGFNQSELFATMLGNRLHVPVENDYVVRSIYTKPQVEMVDRNHRINNMKNVFVLRKKLKNVQKPIGILLVDDVFTTGATLLSAAALLKKNGAPFVWGVTIAQGSLGIR